MCGPADSSRLHSPHVAMGSSIGRLTGPEGLGRPPDLTAPLPDNLTVPSVGAMNVWTAPWSTVMQLGTKYLSTAVTLGSRFGDWRLCWRRGRSPHPPFSLSPFLRRDPPPKTN